MRAKQTLYQLRYFPVGAFKCVEKGLEPLPLDDETNEQPFALLYKAENGL